MQLNDGGQNNRRRGRTRIEGVVAILCDNAFCWGRGGKGGVR